MFVFICKIYSAMICNCDIYNSKCVSYCPFTKESYLNLIKEKTDNTIQFKNKIYDPCSLREWYDAKKTDNLELYKFLKSNEYLFDKCKPPENLSSSEEINFDNENSKEDVLSKIENKIKQNIENKIQQIELIKNIEPKNNSVLLNLPNIEDRKVKTPNIINNSKSKIQFITTKNIGNVIQNSYISNTIPKDTILNLENKNFKIKPLPTTVQVLKTSFNTSLFNVNKLSQPITPDQINFNNNLKTITLNLGVEKNPTVYETKYITLHDVRTKFFTIPTKLVVKTVFEEEKSIPTKIKTITVFNTESVTLISTTVETKSILDTTTLIKTKSVYDTTTVSEKNTVTTTNVKTSIITEYETVTISKTSVKTVSYNKKNDYSVEKNTLDKKEDYIVKNSVSISKKDNVEPITIIYTKTVEIPRSKFLDLSRKDIMRDDFDKPLKNETKSDFFTTSDYNTNSKLNYSTKNSLKSKSLILSSTKTNLDGIRKNNLPIFNTHFFSKAKNFMKPQSIHLTRKHHFNNNKTTTKNITKTVTKNITKSITNTITEEKKIVSTQTKIYTSKLSKTTTVNSTKFITKTHTQIYTKDIDKTITRINNKISTEAKIFKNDNIKKSFSLIAKTDMIITSRFDNKTKTKTNTENHPNFSDSKTLENSIVLNKDEKNKKSKNTDFLEKIKKMIPNLNIFEKTNKPAITYTITSTIFLTINKNNTLIKDNIENTKILSNKIFSSIKNHTGNDKKISDKMFFTKYNLKKNKNNKSTYYYNDPNSNKRIKSNKELSDDSEDNKQNNFKEKKLDCLKKLKMPTKVKIKIKPNQKSKKKKVLLKAKKKPLEKFQTKVKEFSIVEEIV